MPPCERGNLRDRSPGLSMSPTMTSFIGRGTWHELGGDRGVLRISQRQPKPRRPGGERRAQKNPGVFSKVTIRKEEANGEGHAGKFPGRRWHGLESVGSSP